MEYIADRITIDDKLCNGKPTIRGLRITVQTILEFLGAGETKEEVLKSMDDLVAHGCDVLTIGQYLQPTKMHLDVAEFIHPDTFAFY